MSQNIEPNDGFSQRLRQASQRASDDPTHEIECQDLVDVLYEYVDGSCDENLRQLLQFHVDSCPSCVEQLGVEREVRELLKTRCVESAPTELRSRITSQLRVVYRSSRSE